MIGGIAEGKSQKMIFGDLMAFLLCGR